MTNAALPTSRLGRLARFAVLGARAGVGKVASLAGDREAESGVALAAASALGTMRGLALKLGQMAKPKRLVLFHHDPDRGDAQLDAMGKDAQAWMTERGVATQVVMASEGLEYNLPL